LRFALFYEIPVPRPWDPESELRAYQQTIDQAVAGEAWGWDAFWSVEHHFLEEFSHCSNPEVLYGAIAARTKRIRLGYGVRLMPKPYNHPVRSAESIAVLDLISGGRVDVGTGRSATRAELEGFGIDPHETRAMWREALGHLIGCWTNERYAFDGHYWSMPERRVQPKPIQRPHPPLWGATASEEGHRQMGELGIGLCSFALNNRPEEIKAKIDIYRSAIASCTQPVGSFVNDCAAAFTLALCAPDRQQAMDLARPSFEWYLRTDLKLLASVAEWLAEGTREMGSYGYADDVRSDAEAGRVDDITLDDMVATGSCVLGTPRDCVEACRRYEAAGVDMLLCNVNPYSIPHEAVMQTIELMGRDVIPKLR
jgi:alkanesulfonate monooxygenase SsuD/methylene tetrahydromethanopterin reductase-like flavin-dependent oxidoreductase (luciferase family)